jgi:spermidine synthase
MSEGREQKATYALFPALFFGGMAALAYETAWGRMLHRVFGVGDQAVATVLAAFFLGLGLGSALGGKLAARLAAPSRAYAGLEIAVGGWALLSLALIPRIHHAYAAVAGGLSPGALVATRFAFAMVVLLPPTVFMGATLPLAVASGSRDEGREARFASALYAVNTLGAVFGAGLTGLVLLPRLGARACVELAAAASVLAGLLALFGAPRDMTRATSATSARVIPSGAVATLPLALAALTGLTALASEVLWTRVLRIVLQGTMQAFAAMLVCYLAGIAAGSVVAERVARRAPALRVLGAFQAAAGLLTVVGIAAAPQLVRVLVLLQGEAEVIPHDPAIILAISGLLLLPIGTVLGASVPLLFRAVMEGRASATPTDATEGRASATPTDATEGRASVDARPAGAHAGRILAANTLGGLVGALLAGFVVVPLPRVGGVENALYAVAALHFGMATAALVASSPRGVFQRIGAALGPAALFGVALLWRPTLALPFLLDAWYDPADAAIAGPTGLDAPPLFLREGRGTTVTVLWRDRTLRLFNDGRPESGLASDEPGFGPELVLLGGLPSLFAERTDRAMMVGLGAGHSTTMLLAGPFRRVDVVELESAVADAARLMYELRNAESERPLPFPLDDTSRVHLTIDDGRARLELTPDATYDAVVSQASHPWLAGGAALYTREFFLETRRVLRPGGVLCQWVNIFRMDERGLRAVVRTLRSVYGHVIAFVVEDSSLVLLASDRPLRFDDRIERRLDASPELRRFFAPYRLDGAADLLATLELDDAGTEAFARGAGRSRDATGSSEGEILIDDRPSLEHRLSRIPHHQSLEYRDLDAAFAAAPWLAPEAARAIDPEVLVQALARRLERLRARLGGIERVARTAAHLTPVTERRLAEGLVAEARGEVDRALALYDRAADPEASRRADALRDAEQRDAELVEVALHRATAPSEGTPLLRAALRLGARDALRALLATNTREGWADPLTQRAAVAFVEGGCEGLVARATEEASRILDPALLHRVTLCARALGRPDAGAWAERAELARRGVGLRELGRGSRAADGGNDGAAIVHLRRALAAVPGHRRAAQRLVELLHQRGDAEEAQQVLDEALWTARFLPGGAEHDLVDLGERLGLRVRPPRTPTPPPSAAIH